MILMEGYHNTKTDFRSYFLSFDTGARREIMNKPVMEDCDKTLNRTGGKTDDYF